MLPFEPELKAWLAQNPDVEIIASMSWLELPYFQQQLENPPLVPQLGSPISTVIFSLRLADKSTIELCRAQHLLWETAIHLAWSDARKIMEEEL